MIALATEQEEKSRIREEISRKRNAMTDAEAESKSTAIIKNLAKLAEYKKARAVMFYAAKGNEVQTRKLVEAALKEGKTVLLPITNTSKKEIEPAVIENYDSDLKKGAFGIMEPDPFSEKVQSKNESDDAKIDVVIVPGVAFDLEGHMLGYGHGFYDKLLRRLNAARIGLAYDFQIVKKLPRESHDEKMDIIVTESRTINASGG